MRIARTFNGTGATVYLGLGFIPDWVRAYNLESTLPIIIEWNRQMRAGSVEGVNHAATTVATSPEVTAADKITRLTAGTGISPFYGTVLAAGSTAYLRPHANPDFRYQGTLGAINKWTLDTAANRTGHVNAGVPTTYVGVGSRITIKESTGGLIKSCGISAITNDGDAADELTLDIAVKTGEVLALGPMYDLIGGSAGDRIPAGICIANNTFNASGNIILIEAGTYED